jgi:hypothetical protein
MSGVHRRRVEHLEPILAKHYAARGRSIVGVYAIERDGIAPESGAGDELLVVEWRDAAATGADEVGGVA